MSEHSPGTGLVGFGKFDEQWGVPVFKAIVGELDAAAAAGAVTDEDTMMAYAKQLVTNSERIMEIAEHLYDMQVHSSLVFPAASNLTCTLTAHADADTWSAWVEVVDSGANSLSTPFAATTGHIVGMQVESTNTASTVYMIDVAYSEAKTPLCQWRIVSETNQLSVNQIEQIRGDEIPAGQTIYARVMCADAGSKTALVHFRYFVH